MMGKSSYIDFMIKSCREKLLRDFQDTTNEMILTTQHKQKTY